jgi:hypothetical protein
MWSAKSELLLILQSAGPDDRTWLERVQHLATEKLGELEGSGKAKNDDED